MATSKNQEIEQLKQQLNEKVGEFRDIYNKVLEKGGEELSDDILDAVTGGGGALFEGFYSNHPRPSLPTEGSDPVSSDNSNR